MIIKRIKDPSYAKDMMEIRYHPDCEHANRIIDQIEAEKEVLIGFQGDTTYRIYYHDLYYAESVDDRVILYTKKDSYSSNFKLYALEDLDDRFFRIHKSMIVNVKKIKGFKSTFNAKLEALLDNGEKLEINRTYVKKLKERMFNQ